MEHTHLDTAALESMLDLDRSADQNRNLLHQIAVCPECRKVGGYLLDLHQAGLLPPELAEEMVVIFHAQDVHREALAAVAMFRQAVALETATAEMVRRLALDLEKVRRGPEV